MGLLHGEYPEDLDGRAITDMDFILPNFQEVWSTMGLYEALGAKELLSFEQHKEKEDVKTDAGPSRIIYHTHDYAHQISAVLGGTPRLLKVSRPVISLEEAEEALELSPPEAEESESTSESDGRQTKRTRNTPKGPNVISHSYEPRTLRSAKIKTDTAPQAGPSRPAIGLGKGLGRGRTA